MTVALPVTLPKTVQEQRLKVKCVSALKLAYATCIAEDMVAGCADTVYVRLEVEPVLFWHPCQKIGASSRFSFNTHSLSLLKGDVFEYKDALLVVETHWHKFVQVIIAGLVVTAGEKNEGAQQSEEIQLTVGVYMHDKSVRKWVERFVHINLAEYGIVPASE